MDHKTIVCPWTGGADSTALIYYLSQENAIIKPFYVNYNNSTAPIEIEMINKIYMELSLGGHINRDQIKPVTIISADIPEYHSKWTDESREDYYVPGRNLMIYGLGLAFAESINADEFALPIYSENADYDDDTIEFGTKLQALTKIPITMRMQYITDMWNNIELMDTLGILNWVIWARCNDPLSNGPCGKCVPCLEAKSYISKRGPVSL